MTTFRGVLVGTVIALILSALLILIGVGRAEGSVTKFRVVISGDSIIRLSETHLVHPDVFVDAEDGRQAYLRGTSGRLSSDEAARLLIPMVEPGGYFVFQDNGAAATKAEWRTLLQTIVGLLPADRCLIGVLPVFTSPPAALSTYEATAAKANIMVQEFSQHPCVNYVRWNQRILGFGTYAGDPRLEWVYDGQHPTLEGAAWLAGDILSRTGTVAPSGCSTSIGP